MIPAIDMRSASAMTKSTGGVNFEVSDQDCTTSTGGVGTWGPGGSYSVSICFTVEDLIPQRSKVRVRFHDLGRWLESRVRVQG